MELTGQALIDFWAWYFKPETLQILKRWSAYELRSKYKTGIKGSIAAEKIRFIALSDSEKIGVYEDWFGSVGITCGIFTYNGYDPVIYRGYVADCGTLASSKSRPEARTAEIEKANEIYNERNK